MNAEHPVLLAMACIAVLCAVAAVAITFTNPSVPRGIAAWMAAVTVVDAIVAMVILTRRALVLHEHR